MWQESSLEIRLGGWAWAGSEICQILVFEGDTVANRELKLFEQDDEVLQLVF